MKALVYESNAGILYMVILDVMGNALFVSSVPPDSVLPMIQDVQRGKSSPLLVGNLHNKWEDIATMPGCRLIYVGRPLWESMRESGRQAFKEILPQFKTSFPRAFVVVPSTIKNRNARHRVIDAICRNFKAEKSSNNLIIHLASLEHYTALIKTIKNSKGNNKEFCRIISGSDVLPIY